MSEILFKTQNDRLYLMARYHDLSGTDYVSIARLPMDRAAGFAAGHPDIGWYLANRPSTDGVDPLRLRVSLNTSDDYDQVPFILECENLSTGEVEHVHYISAERVHYIQEIAPSSLLEHHPIDWEGAELRTAKRDVRMLEQRKAELLEKIARIEAKRQPGAEASASPELS